MDKRKRGIREFDLGAALRPRPLTVSMSLGLVIILEVYLLSQFTIKILPFEGATYVKARLIVGLMLFLPLWILSYAVVAFMTYRR